MTGCMQDFRQLLQHRHVGMVRETGARGSAKTATVETAATFQEEFGFDPAFFVDYLAIVGALPLDFFGCSRTVYQAKSARWRQAQQ